MQKVEIENNEQQQEHALTLLSSLALALALASEAPLLAVMRVVNHDKILISFIILYIHIGIRNNISKATHSLYIYLFVMHF